VLILALDTTTRAGSAAVLRDHEVLALVPGDGTRTHGERLPEELATALATARVRLEDVDLLAVAIGPGAFTGLRIGLAAMQGLAITSGRPVAGVSALEALAAAAAAERPTEATRIGVWMDAARGEVFAALYDVAPGPDGLPVLREVDAPSVGSPSATLARWGRDLEGRTVAFVGDGAVRYESTLTGPGLSVVPSSELAPWIARLAIRLSARGLAGPPHALQPLYVRRPDAEIARDRTAS
jgi:tRNA threonylcarbamoyladenosine biosynthesis protein TsaB